MKRLVVAVGLMLSLLAVAASAQSTGFTPWTAPVNLGPGVNSSYFECCLTVSKNGLSLFFRAYRDNLNRLYVSKRASVADPWGPAQEIVGFNDGYGFTCPSLSPDEHRLFFVSGRPGGCGAGDLWVSRRHDRKDDFGWGPPVNLGCAPNGPNSLQGESVPTVFEDETGTEVLYFSSGRPGLGGGDIWQSPMRTDGTFGPATLVAELSSTSFWEQAAIRRDGLEAILSSNRSGGLYASNFWTSTRASTADPWSAPVLEPVLSSSYGGGGRTQITFDGREFYFCSSNRPDGYGSSDL